MQDQDQSIEDMSMRSMQMRDADTIGPQGDLDDDES